MSDEEKATKIAESLNKANGSNCLLPSHQAAIAMAEWKEEQMINRACLWLSLNAGVFGFFKKTKLQKMVNEFAKAMKGGEE